MADWRKVAMAAILSDGKIDAAECKILKRELWADKRIDTDEVRFLVDLRNAAQKKAKASGKRLTPAFNTLFFKAIADNVLRDGKITANETSWLRQMLYADGRIDAREHALMKQLYRRAKERSPEFEALYREVEGKAKPKAKGKKAAAKKK
jgi:hypothetical protein